MDPTESQQLQISILIMLQAQGPIGMQSSHLLPKLRLEYRELTEPTLALQLRTLADRQLAIEFDGAFNTKRWRILGGGTSQLQEAGLA